MMKVPRKHAELFWPRVVMRKWLNINSKESNFSADESDLRDENEREEEYYNSDDSQEENGDVDGDGDDKVVDEAWLQSNVVESIPRRRRRNSETFRTQYINTKELRLCVGTWNIGGILPPDNLDTNDWLDTDELADIYVIGLQEMVPLNAGNIFGAEDSSPIPKWENIIRERLNRVQPVKPKFKCYSAPTSPSKFKPSEDVIDIEHELLTDTDTDSDSDSEEIHPSYDESNGIDEISRSESDELRRLKGRALERQFSSLKRFDKIYCLKKEDEVKKLEASTLLKPKKKLTKTLSGIERIGLSWPEPPMNFIGQHVLETPGLPVKSLKEFLLSGSFKLPPSMKSKSSEDAGLVSEVPLINSRKRSPFVMIVCKQMVGVFISIWVRRSLRRHIHNLKVSTVGVGIMGYIGNKGAVSVSMSVYQTPFCFICSHLTSGEKDGDELKRNADVQEIHRRTRFRSVSGIGLPKAIHDHERIIWFGDLNYRINLPYTKTRRLISRKDWPKLIENDQLVKEFKKGRAFDGWTEGILNFPPTYKYEHNSDKYRGEDPKAGRRNPAWCDRILSYGKGMRLLEYKRIENKLSDHRPVTAIYMVEVEVFSHRKLQKALAFTDAEVEDAAVVDNIDLNIGLSRLRFGEDGDSPCSPYNTRIRPLLVSSSWFIIHDKLQDKLAPEPIGRKPFIVCSITGYF